VTSFIDLHHVTYSYPAAVPDARPALNDVSLEIGEGEYIALVGANGSGKSTLARHLNALLVPDTGEVCVGGLGTRDQAHHPEIRRTVGMVFQRPDDQIIATMVAHDVAFGLENLGVPADEIRARVEATLRAVSLWDDRDRPPHMLSAGQAQRLALAGVLAMRPRCIVFDEATAMLDPAGRRTARRMMRELHAEGLTIVTITHRMGEVLDADRVVVLDRGSVAMDGTPAEIFSQPDSLNALGLDLPPVIQLARALATSLHGLPEGLATPPALVDAIDRLRHRAIAPPTGTSAGSGIPSPIIEAHGLGHTYMLGTPFARRALDRAEIAIGDGSAHGLIGATGAGKSTLMQHLNGLLRPQEGVVRVADYDLGDPRTNLRAVRHLVGLVFQHPEAQIFEQYVGDEVAYGPRLSGLRGLELRSRVRWAMDLVGLDFAAFKDRPTFALSGGEQRRVALASTLALRPQVLLLDEPTAGLDPRARDDLIGRLSHLRQGGTTLLVSSHEMADIAALTKTVTVMDAGRTPVQGPLAEVFADGEGLAHRGLTQPVVTQIAEGLRTRGWPLPSGITDIAVLVHTLTFLVAEESQ